MFEPFCMVNTLVVSIFRKLVKMWDSCKIKTSKIINDMTKVQQKSEKISAFGGIFFVLDKFDRILSSVIDSHLGLRSKLIGYQYSEIIRAVFSVFCCGGDCMEDLNLYLKDVLTERPHTRVPSADTVLRGIKDGQRL